MGTYTSSEILCVRSSCSKITNGIDSFCNDCIFNKFHKTCATCEYEPIAHGIMCDNCMEYIRNQNPSYKKIIKRNFDKNNSNCVKCEVNKSERNSYYCCDCNKKIDENKFRAVCANHKCNRYAQIESSFCNDCTSQKFENRCILCEVDDSEPDSYYCSDCNKKLKI